MTKSLAVTVVPLLSLTVAIMSCSQPRYGSSAAGTPPGPRHGRGTATPKPNPSQIPTAVPSIPPTAVPVAPPPKLNVLLVTVDAMRADMPWAGYPRDIAPILTALEKTSVSYTRAYAISSYTAMSVGGFLSGRYPSEMNRSGYFFSVYPDSELMFPELLQKSGVRTIAAHAHFYFDKKKKAGFQQGFDVWRIVPEHDDNNKTDRNVTSPKHMKLAIELLSDPANTSSQFFAWFHFMDPHDVYVKHKGFRSFGPRSRDRYDGEIFFTDHHIGKLLEFVASQPWGKHTAIIINSDHGEGFGEHKRYRHGFEIWDELVKVPLFFKIPHVKPRRINAPRSMIDVAPTIMELLGVPGPPNFQGVSLLPEIKGEKDAELRDVIVDLPRTSDNDRRRALIYDRYKLTSYGDDFRYHLFDLIDDPGERLDLRRRKKDVYKMMKNRYKERTKKIEDVCPKMRHKLKGRMRGKEC